MELTRDDDVWPESYQCRLLRPAGGLTAACTTSCAKAELEGRLGGASRAFRAVWGS